MDTGQAGMDEWTDMFIDSIAPKKKKKKAPQLVLLKDFVVPLLSANILGYQSHCLKPLREDSVIYLCSPLLSIVHCYISTQLSA